MSGIMADAMIIMDHTYIKGERVSGFQVIGSRSGPDHIYSSCAPKDSSTPPKRGSKRAVSTPTGQTPTHEPKRIELDEKTRHNKWSLDETSFLREYSQTLRKDGVSENSFWNNCAIAMNNMFGGKNRTGKSCKMAAWRLNLSGTCNSTMCTSVNEDFVDFTPLSETKGNNVGTQTDLSFNNKQRSNKQDWVFFEPRKNLQGTTNVCAETVNTAALRRLRTYSELKESEIQEIIQKISSSSPREVAGHILSSPLRGSIIVELLNEIEYAAKECCNKDSVLAQKDFCDLAEFKWHELIDELLEQQPLLADVLLAVSLPTSKIGNTKSVQSLIPVISTVFGILMKTRYQELSLVQKMIAMTLANEQTSQKVQFVSTVFGVFFQMLC